MTNWITTEDFSDLGGPVIQRVDGVAFPPVPRWIHRCSAYERRLRHGRIDVERCACGAARFPARGAGWRGKNVSRRADLKFRFDRQGQKELRELHRQLDREGVYPVDRAVEVARFKVEHRIAQILSRH